MKFTRYGYGTIRFFLIISLLIDLAAFMIDIVWLKVVDPHTCYYRDEELIA